MTKNDFLILDCPNVTDHGIWDLVVKQTHLLVLVLENLCKIRDIIPINVTQLDSNLKKLTVESCRDKNNAFVQIRNFKNLQTLVLKLTQRLVSHSDVTAIRGGCKKLETCWLES